MEAELIISVIQSRNQETQGKCEEGGANNDDENV
jgi:hypothetical protein